MITLEYRSVRTTRHFHRVGIRTSLVRLQIFAEIIELHVS